MAEYKRLDLSSDWRIRAKTPCLAIIHGAQLRTTWWHQILKDDTNAAPTFVWRQWSTGIKGWGWDITGAYLQTWPPTGDGALREAERHHQTNLTGARIKSWDTSRVSLHWEIFLNSVLLCISCFCGIIHVIFKRCRIDQDSLCKT